MVCIQFFFPVNKLLQHPFRSLLKAGCCWKGSKMKHKVSALQMFTVSWANHWADGYHHPARLFPEQVWARCWRDESVIFTLALHSGAESCQRNHTSHVCTLSLNKCKTNKLWWTKDMAQWAKHLPHKHEDWSLDPKGPRKARHCGTCV